jgi:IS5 family transposase
MTGTADFFRSRLDQMIDLRHPLAVLASRMPWQELGASIAHLFAKAVRAGQRIEDVDPFGGVAKVVGAGISPTGRPRLPLRLMISLQYLKHAFNESEEGVVERWAETPTWQYFSGMDYFEHRWPCDPTALVHFRKAMDEEGVEALLQQSINVALTLKLISKASLSTVIVDSTIQHKAIAYPTDAKMLETARTKLVAAAKDQGIELKQTFAKEGNHLCRKAGRHADAKQYKRMRKTIKRQRTIVGRLRREIDRKLSPLGQAAQEAMASTLAKAGRVFDQTKGKKIKGGQPKLYSWHAPEAHCFSKGKARTPFEFGAKVGIAVTAKGNLIVGARAFTGAPFEGHTLHEQIEQTTILLQDSGIKPTTAVVDLVGYHGVDAESPELTITHRSKANRLDAEGLKLIKQRNAIEPVIGHLKADHHVDRCHLKDEIGDRLHEILCAAGYNIRWLLRAIARKGLTAFLRLLPAPAVTAVVAWLADHRDLMTFTRPSNPVAVA